MNFGNRMNLLHPPAKGYEIWAGRIQGEIGKCLDPVK